MPLHPRVSALTAPSALPCVGRFSYPLENFPLVPTDTVYTGGSRSSGVLLGGATRLTSLGTSSNPVLSPSSVAVV